MIEITMPRLSDSMEEGTVLAWLKQAGDVVEVGEELLEIETDKANMVFESDAAGSLGAIRVGEGETVAVGTTIAVLVGEGEEMPAAAGVAAEPAPVEARESAAAASNAAPVAVGLGGRERVVASPVARRISAAKGVDLESLVGSGPRGRILKADVELATAAPVTSPGASGSGAVTAKGEVESEDLSRLQATIARRMSESKATAPHFYLRAEVDVGAAVAARCRLKATASEEQVVPSFNDLVVKAGAIALREFPRANGSYREGRFELHSRVNVGIAVAVPDALVVPTIFDADRKGLAEIATRSRALAGRVRDGSVTPPELAGATFTVSNLGMYGVRGFDAIVDAPQAAILAVGEIATRPVVRGDRIEVGQLLELTLSCDHRILYGAEAAAFLARVCTLLEEPLALAL